VTSLRHHTVPVSDFDRQVLPLLDGTRNRAALLAELLERFRRGQLTLARAGKPVTERHEARAILASTLDQRLPQLASAALLVA
jgi:methyltransferase-like protein